MVRGIEELAPSRNAQGVVTVEERLQRRSILGPAWYQLHGTNSGTEVLDCTGSPVRRRCGSDRRDDAKAGDLLGAPGARQGTGGALRDSLG